MLHENADCPSFWISVSPRPLALKPHPPKSGSTPVLNEAWWVGVHGYLCFALGLGGRFCFWFEGSLGGRRHFKAHGTSHVRL